MGKIIRSDKHPPDMLLADAIINGTEDSIESMEQRGGEQVRSQDLTDWVSLPSALKGRLQGSAVRNTDLQDIEDFEQLGFQFHPHDRACLISACAAAKQQPGNYFAWQEYLEKHLEDPLFVRAQLPPGWKIADGGHQYGYWNYILDEKGFERVAIFYKAAFYDRKVPMSITKVPMTIAQQESAAAWREAKGYEGEHHWRVQDYGALEDGSVQYIYERYQIPKRTEKSQHMALPTFVYEEVTLHIMPDGTLTESCSSRDGLIDQAAWLEQYGTD